MMIYGIDPATHLVEEVAVTRGGTITLTRLDRPPSSYRIKGGKPPLAEVSRVFGLTDLVAISAGGAPHLHNAGHPSLSRLEDIAASRRHQARHETD